MQDAERILDSRDMDIIGAFNSYSVRYLIVGGYAMLFYGYEDRPVIDLDIWVNREDDNAYKCWNALNAIMPNCLNFQPDYLTKKGIKIDLRNNHYDVEIFTSMEGADFDVAFSRFNTWEQEGEILYFVGVTDLLNIKRFVKKMCPERTEKESNDIYFLENLIAK